MTEHTTTFRYLIERSMEIPKSITVKGSEVNGDLSTYRAYDSDRPYTSIVYTDDIGEHAWEIALRQIDYLGGLHTFLTIDGRLMAEDLFNPSYGAGPFFEILNRYIALIESEL